MHDLVTPSFSLDEADFLLQLGNSVRSAAALPLEVLLEQEGILKRLAREAALAAMVSGVVFTPEETPAVIAQLWQGVQTEPPTDLHGDWLALVPSEQQQQLRQRWRELRLQKCMDVLYSHRIDSYFLERRAELERVVYGMIRVRNQGAAEELYLRLIDDAVDFSTLASAYSLGDERYTHGLVGPMPIGQPHPSIRQALTPLAVGEIAAPLRIDDWVLILRMEHREPARLTEATRQQLTTELFEADLTAFLAGQDLAAAAAAQLQSPAMPISTATAAPDAPIVDITHTSEPGELMLPAGSEA